METADMLDYGGIDCGVDDGPLHAPECNKTGN